MCKMKEVKISPGGSSGQSSLIIAVLLGLTGFYHLFQEFDHGRILGYIFSVFQIALACYFFFGWYRYSNGCCKFAFDFSVYEIREDGIVTASGHLSQLTNIIQDGRGYTVTGSNGHRYRLLRKDLDIELQSALDFVQKESRE